MQDTHRQHLLSTTQGDLCLAITYLREADACLRSLVLTPQDRVSLQGQVQRMHQLMQRIDLWLSLGDEDLDEELARLIGGDSQGPENE